MGRESLLGLMEGTILEGMLMIKRKEKGLLRGLMVGSTPVIGRKGSSRERVNIKEAMVRLRLGSGKMAEGLDGLMMMDRLLSDDEL